eukprot:12765448-Heterocapsa_arctica.AAC.1
MGTTGPLPGNWRHEGTPRPKGSAAFGICTNHSQCNGEEIPPHQNPQFEMPVVPNIDQDQGKQASDEGNFHLLENSDDGNHLSTDNQETYTPPEPPHHGHEWIMGEIESQHMQ